MLSSTPAPKDRLPDAVAFSVLYLPGTDGTLQRDVQGVVEDFLIPQVLARDLQTLTESRPARLAAEKLCRELLSEFSPQVQKQFEALRQGPFELRAANRLRDHISEHNGDEAVVQWGAVIGLARYAGLLTANGTRLYSVARKHWIHCGLRAHRVVLPFACPNCRKEARVSFAPPVADLTLQWRIDCSSCTYVDQPDFHLTAGAPQWSTTPESFVHGRFSSNPALTGDWLCSQARRAATLHNLQKVCADFDDILRREVQSGVEEFREHWNHHHELPAGFSPQLRESSLGIWFNALPNDTFWHARTVYERMLQRWPHLHKRLSFESNRHPAAHWEREFERRWKSFEREVDAEDVVRACIQLQLLVQACTREGLLTPVVVYLSASALPEPTPSHGSHAPGTPERVSIAVSELAGFLAQKLSTQVVRFDEAALERLIVQFSKTRE